MNRYAAAPRCRSTARLRPRIVSRHRSNDSPGAEPHVVALGRGELGVVRVAAPVDGWTSSLRDQARTRCGPASAAAPMTPLAIAVRGRDGQTSPSRLDAAPRRRPASTSTMWPSPRRSASRPRRTSTPGRAMTNPAAPARASTSARVRARTVSTSALSAAAKASATRSAIAASSIASRRVSASTCRRCAGRSAGRGTPPRCGPTTPARCGPGVVVAGDQPPQLAADEDRHRHRRADAHVREVLDVDRRHAAQRRRCSGRAGAGRSWATGGTSGTDV